MLKDKTVLVTGGSRGIGAACAEAFAKEGANVAIIYSGNAEKSEKVAKECTDKYGVKAVSFKCNVADFDEVKAVVNEVKKEFGTVNVLVNNAGINKDGLLPMMSEADFDNVIAVNLKGTFNMIRHLSGVFIRNKGGSIINISSVAGLIGNPGQANYSASKAGIVGLTKSVAREFAKKGITCNAIAPGFIKTDMTEEFEDKKEMIESIVPLGHMGTCEDIARTAVFLAQSPYITGEVVRVDGGVAM